MLFMSNKRVLIKPGREKAIHSINNLQMQTKMFFKAVGVTDLMRGLVAESPKRQQRGAGVTALEKGNFVLLLTLINAYILSANKTTLRFTFSTGQRQSDLYQSISM